MIKLKKEVVITIFISVITALFLQPKIIKGQSENTFQCAWDVATGCNVDISTIKCESGFQPDNEVCQSKTNMGDCQGAINNICISTTPPEETCYACIGLECIPYQKGSPECEYDTHEACSNACKGIQKRYRCENKVCIEDSKGEYDGYFDCEANCTQGKPPMEDDSVEDDPKKNKVFCDASGKPTNDPSSGKLYTAIGCIPLDETGFISFVLRWAIGLGGGIAFLLIILASFQIMTSRGDPKRLEAGKELLTSAIMGLILLVFSVTILKIIGVNILQIGGF